MKVNPVGIQAYEQLVQRDKQTNLTEGAKSQKQQASKVSIEPQSELTKSELAIKAPSGSYAEYLTPQEKQALDLLFGKFRENGKLGVGYSKNSNNDNETTHLGSVVDVKV
ncbi:MAG: hypothetical protein DRP35_02140 [Candidatus Zixiibacteriota bacterium]|nr:MAG: hypothetical protein DRP35_02140 [candidate division Zixibacteria bacterium]